MDFAQSIAKFCEEEDARKLAHRTFFNSVDYQVLLRKITTYLLQEKLSKVCEPLVPYIKTTLNPLNCTTLEFNAFFAASMQYGRDQGKIISTNSDGWEEEVYKTPQLYFSVIYGQGSFCSIWSPEDWEKDHKLHVR